MSASAGNSEANRLTTTSLAVPAGSTLLLMLWCKRQNTLLSNISIACELNESGGSNATPRARLLTDGGGGLGNQAHVDGTVTGSAAAPTDTWQHRALWFEGWDNTSNNLSNFNNGTLSGFTTVTANFPSTTLTAFALFNRFGFPSGGQYIGRLAEPAIYSGITATQRDTIITAAQTLGVHALPIAPLYSWRLLGNANAAVGGVNLAATGTVTFDAGDHPPVGDAPTVTGWRRRAVFIH